MARYTGPVCRICRREGVKLFLKGERCYTKCPLNHKKIYPPGQHGQIRKKLSEYGLELREKQKARRMYGVLDAQFRRYVEAAQRSRGVTGEVLLQTLERRLDNVVYRAGLASSRPEARQLVRHGHFAVNGRKVSIPSYQLRPGDVVQVRPKSREMVRLQQLQEVARTRPTPPWLSYNPDQWEVTVVRLPERSEVDAPVEEHLIVELYSR
ncbi:MAG: 30S ribosomal protein S4 [Firmicutes bacterium]|nr:30S ribosomal protein S4 [Bacillota bacterium]